VMHLPTTSTPACYFSLLTLKLLETVYLHQKRDEVRTDRERANARAENRQVLQASASLGAHAALYDQIGVLAPVAVDRCTGYRSYMLSQLPRLRGVNSSL